MELGLEQLPKGEAEALFDHMQRFLWPSTQFSHFYGADGSISAPPGFSGMRALPINRRHLPVIENNGYVAYEKSDGARYLLFLTCHSDQPTEALAFLLSEAGKLYRVPTNRMAAFVNPPNDMCRDAGQVGAPLIDTLVDCELVRNKETHRFELHIIDGISINGDSQLGDSVLEKRLEVISEWVIKPHVELETPNHDIKVRLKTFYTKSDLPKLFADVHKDDTGEYRYMGMMDEGHQACNRTLGVVLMPVDLPYQRRTSEHVFRWHYPAEQYVCFKVKLDDRTGQAAPGRVLLLLAANDGKEYVHREVNFGNKMRHDWFSRRDEFDGRVIECVYDRGAGEWRYKRTRRDRSRPHAFQAVVHTMETVAQDINRDVLVQACTGQRVASTLTTAAATPPPRSHSAPPSSPTFDASQYAPASPPYAMDQPTDLPPSSPSYAVDKKTDPPSAPATTADSKPPPPQPTHSSSPNTEQPPHSQQNTNVVIVRADQRVQRYLPPKKRATRARVSAMHFANKAKKIFAEQPGIQIVVPVVPPRPEPSISIQPLARKDIGSNHRAHTDGVPGGDAKPEESVPPGRGGDAGWQPFAEDSFGIYRAPVGPEGFPLIEGIL